jgi:hypothetical protein
MRSSEYVPPTLAERRVTQRVTLQLSVLCTYTTSWDTTSLTAGIPKSPTSISGQIEFTKREVKIKRTQSRKDLKNHNFELVSQTSSN